MMSVLTACCRITNSAVHAKFAVVFAQLLIDGTNHGIHGFLVRIRNEVFFCITILCIMLTHYVFALEKMFN